MQSTIAVKQLVEFVLRSGSIDNRFKGTDRAMQGIRLHNKLQKQMGTSYRKEVSLKQKIQIEDILYTLYGRADGVFADHEKRKIVDEIKTVSVPLESVTENFNKAHWGQGMCYAYMVACQEDLEQVGVQLTYYQVDTQEIKRFVHHFSKEELEEYVIRWLAQYAKWTKMSLAWKEKRNQSLIKMDFPFSSYRQGQRKLAIAVYQTLQEGNRLFASAPTGIGKTVSTLFPALKSMGQEQGDKIFYLTAKTIARTAAQEGLEKIRQKNDDFSLKQVTLTAKDKMCLMEKRNCNPRHCPYADSYFDRVNDAVFEILQHHHVFTQKEIQEFAEKYTLCPYELSLDLSLWCDVIIGDYNYLFDPQAHLQRFFEQKEGAYIFLIDEAHNLPQRAREMYSAYLDKKTVYALKKEMGKKDKGLDKALTELNKSFLTLKKMFAEKEDNRFALPQPPEFLEKPIRNFVKACSDYMNAHKNEEMEEKLLSLYFDCKFFLEIWALYGEDYTTLITTYADQVSMKLFCLDPAQQMDFYMSKGIGTIAFSATFTPLEFYRTLLGSEETGKLTFLESPFSQKNLGLYVAPYIDTKYKEREKSFVPICELLIEFISAKKGNYMVYFPSYLYMEQVYELFTTRYPAIKTMMQKPDASEQDKEAFLNCFQENNLETLCAFCVLGGVYGEGIDLVGERLIGTAIVGVGLPQINIETDCIKNYYQEQNKNGFDFSYTYPGMNKVLQAAGRVIRTEQDKGVVLLMDQRFSTARYHRLMPSHWQHLRYVQNAPQLSQQLKEFWQEDFSKGDGLEK